MPTIENSARKDVTVIWICHRRDTVEGADFSAVWTGTLRAVIVDRRSLPMAGCVGAGCSVGITSVGGGSTVRPPTACVGNGADSKAPSSKQKDIEESEYVRLQVGHCFIVHSAARKQSSVRAEGANVFNCRSCLVISLRVREIKPRFYNQSSLRFNSNTQSTDLSWYRTKCLFERFRIC